MDIKRKYKDLTGQKFGRLTAIEFLGTDKNRTAFWKCVCDCGNEIVVRSTSLRAGKTRSCGCLKKRGSEAVKTQKANKSGAILIRIYDEGEENKNKKCICKCTKCGNVFEAWVNSYYKGRNSCECKYVARDNPRLYSIYLNMKTRCYNSNNSNYKHYGARGIVICPEWKNSFKEFVDWSLSHGYSDELSIDRINVNGNYEPDNCRWATSEEQGNNKTDNVYVDGMTLKQFCKKNNLNYKRMDLLKNKLGFDEWYARYVSREKEHDPFNDRTK